MSLKSLESLFFIGMYSSTRISRSSVDDSLSCIVTKVGMAFRVLVVLKLLVVGQSFAYIKINIEIMVFNV